MKIYIGGYSQGKLKYAINKNKINKCDVINAGEADIDGLINARCIYLLNDWIKKVLDERQINEFTEKLISENPQVIVVCDEVGYGVVPIEKGERIYRELVGRCLIKLAEASDEVERVVCGIGMRIK